MLKQSVVFFFLLLTLCQGKVIKVSIETTSNGTELLGNYQNEYYIGTIYIGSPQQAVVVAFDTMSSNFWVPSTACLCQTTARYNSSASSTYFQNGTSFVTTFGNTTLQGLYDSDNVTIAGVETPATFAEVRAVTGVSPQFLQFGGIYGLGFPGAAYNNVSPPVFQMISQGAIKEPVFSMSLGRDPSQQVGGEILFGGIDNTKFQGNISYIPIKSFNRSDGSEYMKYWQFTMDGGHVKESKFCVGGCQVIVASMVGGILGPKADITSIFSAIGGNPHNLLVSCGAISNYPNVTLTIKGLNYVLRPSDYIIKNKGVCTIGFGVNTQDDSTWLLGNVFLARFYTIFDVGKMSIGLTGAGGGADECRLFGGLLLLTVLVKALF